MRVLFAHFFESNYEPHTEIDENVFFAYEFESKDCDLGKIVLDEAEVVSYIEQINLDEDAGWTICRRCI